MTILTADAADPIIHAVIAHGRSPGFMPPVVAVRDADGHIIAFPREDPSGSMRSDSAEPVPGREKKYGFRTAWPEGTRCTTVFIGARRPPHDPVSVDNHLTENEFSTFVGPMLTTRGRLFHDSRTFQYP